MTNTTKKSQLSRFWVTAILLSFICMSAFIFTACGKKTPKYTVPENLTAIYGQTLADVALTEGFSWEDPVTTPVGNAGVNKFTVTYTPEDTDKYKTVTGIEVSIQVIAATNSITGTLSLTGWTYGEAANQPTGVEAAYGTVVYKYSTELDGNYVPTVPTAAGTYYVKAFVDGTANYSSAESNAVQFTIAQATLTAPTGLTATYGQTLGDVTLPEGFEWEKSTSTKVGMVGVQNFTVKYTAEDAANYTNTTGIEVSIQVTAATNSITGTLSLTGWTYGEAANQPTGVEAAYGTVVYKYSTELDGNYVPTVPTAAGTYYVKAFVDGTANYSSAESNAVQFTIAQATLTAPTGLTATYGQTLGDVTLPEGFEWEKSTSTKVGMVGVQNFTVKYTAEDAANYTNTTGIEVQITVEKADLALDMVYEAKSSVSTVADITIRENKLTYGTVTWDTEDENYRTPLSYGINIRYADLSGGISYNSAEHYPIKIIVNQTDVTSLEELKAAVAVDTSSWEGSIHTIYIANSFTVSENVTVPAGSKLEVNSGVTLTVAADVTLTTNSTTTNKGTIVSKANNASNGEFVYNANSGVNLRTAIRSGFVSKAVLTKDIEVLSSQNWTFTKDTNLVIDLNGFDINGEVVVDNSSNYDVNITITNSQEAESKIIGASEYALFVKGTADNFIVNINNISLESSKFALSTNGEFSGATINATNSKFTSTGSNAIAVYLPAEYTVNFESCEFTGATAVYIKDGNVTFTSCELTANGSYSEPKYEMGGAYSTGSALVVDSAYGYAEAITVTVKDSTLTSANGYGIEECKTAPQDQTATDVATVTEEGSNTFNATKGDKVILN